MDLLTASKAVLEAFSAFDYYKRLDAITNLRTAIEQAEKLKDESYRQLERALHSKTEALMMQTNEIERLREEIASCTADIGREVSEGNRYMLEAAELRQECAALRKIAEAKMDELAAMTKEREEWRHIAEQNAETIRLMVKEDK